MASKTPAPIAIIGGGLGGGILGVGLAQHGVPFHIFEQAPAFTEIGAGIASGCNAVKALGLVSPALLKAYLGQATASESPEQVATFLSFRRGSEEAADSKGRGVGEWLFDLRGGPQARDGTGPPTRLSVHRARFLDEIVKLLPAGCASFGKQLVGIDEPDPDADNDDEDLTLRFADGSSARARAVIGCDGIHSVTRRYLYGPEAKPTFAGQHVYRTLVPRAECEAVIGTTRTVNGQLYVGPGACMITYPVDKGAVINMVAVVSRPDKPWTAAASRVAASAEEMRRELAGWDAKLLGLMERFGTHDKWALFDCQHGNAYHRGRICLLGDAAHGSTPHLGAGAGMAMEDAYLLSRLLKPGQTPAQIKSVFAEYDSARRPRSQELVRLSRLCGEAYSFNDQDIGRDIEKMEEVLTKRSAWLWDEDLEKVMHDLEAKIESKI